ncbi:hypothetical protein GWK18_05335 [Kocuria sp. JC486]|uniref:DoxX family membrane protein n=1 Tax=Kocuria soli TaxID=2485125 RepID=A0A3N3ZTH4_9MICC|nr:MULTISPECIES: hypothetical protein [Kocuria]NHU85022.1 hypothetical protein [Kocuria sp. JC486]ROZ65617.1 hypothetical protein EDL96_00500 [Kocuria soli]
MRLSNAILRGVSGAYILQSGLGKKDLPLEAYEGLQGMAATGIPQLKEWDAKTFGQALWLAEVGVGGLLLTPFVSKRLAGLALTAFSAGMLTMYFNNNEMTQDDGIRPTQEGTPLSKDVWLAAIGLALVVQSKG